MAPALTASLLACLSSAAAVLLAKRRGTAAVRRRGAALKAVRRIMLDMLCAIGRVGGAGAVIGERGVVTLVRFGVVVRCVPRALKCQGQDYVTGANPRAVRA